MYAWRVNLALATDALILTPASHKAISRALHREFTATGRFPLATVAAMDDSLLQTPR